jgi:predicted DCC family thiol-disulfide oxidoreductase YuxK
MAGATVRPDAGRGAERDLTILYDEECGFCRATLGLMLILDRRRRIGALGFADAERRGLAAGIAPDELRRSWHAVDHRGRRFSAGAALAPLLERLPGGRLPARLAGMAPGLVDRAYWAVARRRGALGRLLPARLRERGERELRRRS